MQPKPQSNVNLFSVRQRIRALYRAACWTLRWTARGLRRRLANVPIKWRGTPHIHVLRESEHNQNGAFFDWLAAQRPEAAKQFRFSAATDRSLTPWEGATLFIPWLADPVRERDPVLFEKARALEQAYAARGVPVVNPVSHVSVAIKSRALPRMGTAGVHVARTLPFDAGTPFDAIADEVGTPFIVRNDQGHDGAVHLVHTPADLRDVDWDRFTHPLALEFIDTRGSDGLFRKYRLLFTGDASIPRHLIIAPEWNVHARDRKQGRPYLEEELAYLRAPDPRHDTLNRVRLALGLDYVAFDYSLTADGELVVWEPNPYPVLWNRANAQSPDAYQHMQIAAVFEQVLRFYFDRAGLTRPV